MKYLGYDIVAFTDNTVDIYDSNGDLVDGGFESSTEAMMYIDDMLGNTSCGSS